MAIVKICPHCGIADVFMEAVMSWNSLGQYWRLANMDDNAGFCMACEAEGFVPLDAEEGEEAATFAAHKAGWRSGANVGGGWYNGAVFASWKAAASSATPETYRTAREVCKAHGLLTEAAAQEA